jgi:predicted phage gp36 major capsid-like protein
MTETRDLLEKAARLARDELVRQEHVMEKTEQRDRFEAAWFAKVAEGEDYKILLAEVSQITGKYHSIEMQAAWESWQLCEASALERAALVCDKLAEEYANSSAYFDESDGADLCAQAIRALSASGKGVGDGK